MSASAARTRYLAMGSQQSLARALGGYLRAYQVQSGVIWALRLLGLGLGIDVLTLLTLRLRPLVELPGWWLLLPPVLGLSVGAVLGLAHRPRTVWLAGEIDRRLGLRERTITALELVARPAANGGAALAAEQLADSIHHLRHAEPFEAFPPRAPRRELLAVLALAALILPLVLVAPSARTERATPRLDAVARGEAERIEALADEIEREEAPLDEPDARQHLAQLLREVSGGLRDAIGDADRAMAQLGGAERQLGQMQSPRAFDAAAALSRLADALDRDQRTRSIAEALDRRDYRRAAEEMRQLGARGAQGAPADQQAIAEALRRSAAAAARYDERLAEALREAAERAQGGDPGATEAAAREMSRAGSELRRQENLERALSQLQNSRQALGSNARSPSGQSSAGNRRPGGQGGDERGDGADGARGQAAGQGQGQGDGRGDGVGDGDGQPGSGAGTGSRGRTTDVYDPATVRSRQVRVPGGDFDRPRVEEGDSSSEGPDGEVLVDYRDVLPTYQERATRAMQDRYIPLGMKDLVREYFSSLQPGRP